ncbi:MAG: molybdate ABC transporter permease subunit [Anaerolineales bacterium]|nr:molybdate ABC transporter permease subunit [Anaerolineales bacterium]MCX7753631.1 molybdate ABC transporter permease subunit [Anaerolineales bacterium]MDW8277719.1 molybdate ABC transporter permease subunit [Anaerolineales bacterium]
MNWPPLPLSLWVASWASLLALLLGTPAAWALVKIPFRGKWLAEGLVMAPLVLPPTLLGYYLLTLLGQRGLGPWIEQTLGIRIVFSPWGAVIAATVAALPLVIQTVQVSIAALSREVEEAGRLDGCNEWDLFRLIHLPLIWRGLLAGGVLGFLRALSDFGATLMVAGNIPGRTQTLSMAIYDAVQANDITRANELAFLLTSIGFGLLFFVLRLRQKAGAAE